MATRGEVKAALDRLPWQQRQAVLEAVGDGRAVEDAALAPLAADHAAVTLAQVEGFLTVYLLLGLAASVAGVLWLVSGGDGATIVGGVLVIGSITVACTGLLIWAMSLRPLERARQANLHAAGLADAGPPMRDTSNWVLGCLIAWPILALLGVGLRAAGLDVGAPVGFAALALATWLAKRALDDR